MVMDSICKEISLTFTERSVQGPNAIWELHKKRELILIVENSNNLEVYQKKKKKKKEKIPLTSLLQPHSSPQR